MNLTITPIYAALLAVLFIVLSFRVIFVRRGERISLGDGDNLALRARVRVHANFAEYTPISLLLLLMAELQGGAVLLLHGVGLMLLLGRLAHAYGVSQTPQIMRLRVSGMVLTFLSIAIGALANLWLAFV